MKRMPSPRLLEIAEQVQNIDPRRGVEHADDLVRDEEADVEQERARNQHALELASAQLVGILVENFGRVEADDLAATARASRCHSGAVSPE